MASKKKLRKQIRDLEMRLIGSQARVSSLKADIYTLIEGKDIDRIEQIRIRSNIEYEMDQSIWFGSRVTTYPEVSDNLARTYFGNGFFRQIVDSASEYEEMNQVDTDRLGFSARELSDMKGRRSGMKPGAPQIWKGGAEGMHRHVDDMQLGKKNNVLKAWLDSKPKKK